MTVPGEWEPEAENWARWARTPFHDAYWYYRDAFFDLILPARPAQCVEIGCGEGRVARDLAARGHRVTGVDTSPTLLRHAREADPSGAYVLADSAALPFPDGCFEAAVAYNSLQVVADMPGTVAEASRVLVPGGHLCVVVSHPFADVGYFAGDGSDDGYVIREDYFASRSVHDRVERDGLTMTFRGWTYSLQHYAEAFEQAGLTVDTMREPRPGSAPGSYDRWNKVPMFLMLRTTKR
jgi:SAM-dependent methyltransferase